MTAEIVNMDLWLPEFNATQILMCTCHVDNYTEGRYNMILGRYLITTMVLDIKFSDNIIIDRAGTHEGFLAPMVDRNNYEFKILMDKTIKPEE